MKQKIGIIGRGNVGKALVKQCENLPDYEIAGIAIKHPKKHEDIAKDRIFNDALSLINNPEVEIILEAIDSDTDALTYARAALKLGKTYISANKKMLASHLPELLKLEQNFGGHLLFEAAAGGAIPVIRILSSHLRGQEVTKIRGILNGTCNFILTQMSSKGISFEKALTEAQRLGFAESEPSSDIDGHDAYYKAYLLASIIEGGQPNVSRLQVEGIRNVGQADIAASAKLNEKLKLIAEISRKNSSITIDIRPRSIGKNDPFYHIENETNALEIEGPYFQKILLSGPGAGGQATASAMVSDLMNARQPRVEKIRQLLTALA